MRFPSLDVDYWQLKSAEVMHATYTDTFIIPPKEKRETLVVGDAAKLLFEIEGCDEDGTVEVCVERIFVIVSEVLEDAYIGLLDSQPACIDPNAGFYLGFGVEVPFEPRHVIDIDRPPDDYIEWQLGQKPEKMWDR